MMKVSVEEVKLKNRNAADVYLNVIDKKSADVIIIAHGFDGSKSGSAFRFFNDNLDVSLVSFDFPSHGDSSEELLFDNCLTDFLLVDCYVRERFPGASISLFGSSFGSYIILNHLKKNPNLLYKGIFLKSVAVKMDKIFREILIEEGMESFKKRGYTIKNRNKLMKIPYAFYEGLVNNQITISNVVTDRDIYIFHGTCDDTALFSDLSELKLPNIHIMELVNAKHSFNDAQFSVVAREVKKVLR